MYQSALSCTEYEQICTERHIWCTRNALSCIVLLVNSILHREAKYVYLKHKDYNRSIGGSMSRIFFIQGEI